MIIRPLSSTACSNSPQNLYSVAVSIKLPGHWGSVTPKSPPTYHLVTTYSKGFLMKSQQLFANLGTNFQSIFLGLSSSMRNGCLPVYITVSAQQYSIENAGFLTVNLFLRN